MKLSKHGLLIALVSTFIVACGAPTKPATLSPGSIVVSRPVSQTSHASVDQISPMGFLPLKDTTIEMRSSITISKEDNELSFADKKISFTVNNFDLNNPLSIVHKQKQPVWYANDQYFEARKLPVPAFGHADRFLRGVLGDQALFLNEETAIYSTDLGTLSPAKGIQVSEKDLAFLFDTIAVGTDIEIK